MSQKIEARPTFTSLQWTCSRCGTQNITGDACPNCGALRHVSTNASAPSDVIAEAEAFFTPSATATAGIFLFNTDNRAFVEGRSPKIALEGNWLILTVVMLITTVLLGAFAFPEWLTQQAFNAQGRTTQGVVTSRRTYSTAGKNHHTTHYMLTTTFKVTTGRYEGQTFTNEQEVSDDTYQRLPPSTSTMISFLPDSPTTARLAGANTDNAGQEHISVALCSFVALIGCFVMYIRSDQRATQLVARGHLINGQIVQCSGSKTKHSYSFNLKYAFRSPSGKILTWAESTYRTDLRNGILPQPGTPVTVLYADDRTFRLM